jgi:hypothetical protein
MVDIMVLDMDCCTPLLWENIPDRLSRFMWINYASNNIK